MESSTQENSTLRDWRGRVCVVYRISLLIRVFIIIGSFDATVRLWDCKSQSTKPIQIFEDAKDSISSVRVIGSEIVTGSVDGRMRLYDIRMGMAFVDVVGRMYLPYSFRLLLLTFTEPITSINQSTLSPTTLV